MSKFIVKVLLPDLIVDGKQMTKKMPYIVEAVLFSEAEYRLKEYLSEEDIINVEIKEMVLSNVDNVVIIDNNDDAIFYDVTILFIAQDEKGREKNTKERNFYKAEDEVRVQNFVKESLIDSVFPYRIYSIKETDTVDFIDFEEI